MIATGSYACNSLHRYFEQVVRTLPENNIALEPCLVSFSMRETSRRKGPYVRKEEHRTQARKKRGRNGTEASTTGPQDHLTKRTYEENADADCLFLILGANLSRLFIDVLFRCVKSISGPTIRALLWPTWRNPEYTACSATSTLPRDPRREAPLQTFGILPRGRRLYPTHNPSVRVERIRPEPTSPPRSTPPSRSEATGALAHRPPPFEMDMRQESPRHGGTFPDRGGRPYPRKRHVLPVYHRPGQLNHRSQRKRKGPDGQTAAA